MFQFVLTLARFENTFSEFLKWRLINKQCAELIYKRLFKIDYKDLLYPRRTFIPVGTCWSCSAIGNDVEQQVFIMDEPPRRTVVVCDGWECRLRALLSKLYYIFHINNYVYFYPSIENLLYDIPRSNPETKTKGRIVPHFDNIMIFRHDIYYVYVEWKEEDKTYRKLVPFEKFIESNNISQKFLVRPIYNRTDVLKGYHVFPKDGAFKQ